MTKFFYAFLFLTGTYLLSGQSNKKSVTVKLINEEVILDGVLNEAFWETADIASEFQQFFPTDSLPATQPTTIKMVYDNETLFVGIYIESVGDNWVVPSLQRDFRAGGNDNISLLFDTFNDGTNAFLFGINPYGVRREALVSGGGQGSEGFTTSWDVKWKGEVTQGSNSYTAEIAIPLTSFKFAEGITKWRFQSYRFDQQTNEESVWFKIPQNQLIYNLAFMGEMEFEKPLGRSRTPLAIIPYVNAISEKNYALNQGKNNVKVGGDAKVAIGNGMNLDVTLNPDFSNVEVDDIITNLTRFEIGLPEKRQFFIDNSDLFGTFGGGRDANPFFSRRIGIARDTLGNPIENGILGGIRLSGKLNKNWRLGVLSLQTKEDLDNRIASNNNSMFVIQRKLFSRSNISAFFINRQTFKDYDFLAPEDEFNRVMGIDYNLATADNKWVGKFYAHKSFQPEDDNGNLSLGAFTGLNTKYFNAFIDLVKVDKEFTSDLGFIPRKDVYKSAVSLEGVLWPKTGVLNSLSLGGFSVTTWKPNLDNQLDGINKRTSDFRHSLSLTGRFRNKSQFEFGYANEFTYLINGFDPTNSVGSIPLPGNKGYHTNMLNIGYESNQGLVFSYSAEAQKGRFFEGDIFSVATQMNLRLQPKAIVSLRVDYNNISLPTPYSSADIWLVSPKVELTFSKSVFWSTLIQYSNLQDNLGINSRLQWRFAPLSDLFIVYNDNYFVNQFSPRFRSINLKLTYWLNV